ncbi:MAG: RNA 3'-terminal phosphate cyclase [Phycisphaerales bacterium]
MTDATVHIDGSEGEGGGQILRSALALSMATGRPFVIDKIRAGRVKPGLMRQHLTCVTSAAAICGAKVLGAQVGSSRVEFTPGVINPSVYHFPIGTAGSTIMVLQAILPAMLRASGSSRLIVEGGTHNTKAPSYEFFAEALVPLLRRAGANVQCRMEKRGFYPAGGGRVVVDIEPCGAPVRLEIIERGDRVGLTAAAEVSNLRYEIAEREQDVLARRLGLAAEQMRAASVRDSISPGNVVKVAAAYANITEVFLALGELGKSAEMVANEACDMHDAYVAAGAPVGEYLADQLMVPLALLGGGAYVAGPLTMHATTNIRTLGLFGVGVRATPVGALVRVDVEAAAGAQGKTQGGTP